MFINKDTPDVGKYRVFDCSGVLLPNVLQYDTDSKEITVSIVGLNAGNKLVPAIIPAPAQEDDPEGSYRFAPLTVSFVLVGSFAMYGEEIIGEGNGIHPAIAKAAEQAAAEAAEKVAATEVVEPEVI